MNDDESDIDARFLPVREAAAKCAVTGATIRNWVRRGCPHQRRGSRIYVDPYEAVQWCAEEGLSGRRGRRSTEDRVRAERRAAEARSMRERAGLPGDPEPEEEEEPDPVEVEAEAEAEVEIPPIRDEDGSDAELLLAAKLRKEIALASRHELTVQKLRGELLDASDVRVQRLRRIEVVKAGLLALGARIAPRAVGLDAQAIEGVIEEEVRLLLGEYSKGAQE